MLARLTMLSHVKYVERTISNEHNGPIFNLQGLVYADMPHCCTKIKKGRRNSWNHGVDAYLESVGGGG